MVDDVQESKGSKLETAGFVIDFFSKVLLGVAAAYFTYATYMNSVESECTKNVSHLFDFVFGKEISPDNINSAVSTLVKPTCEGFRTPEQRSKLVETLAGLSAVSKAPSVPAPNALPAPQDGNWVAVGYVGTPDFNFTTLDGKPIGSKLDPGAIIKSKWQVNVRRRPADWRSPLKILEGGDCFVVTSTTLLDAAGQKQLWANGTPKKCG